MMESLLWQQANGSLTPRPPLSFVRTESNGEGGHKTNEWKSSGGAGTGVPAPNACGRCCFPSISIESDSHQAQAVVCELRGAAPPR